MDFLKRWDQWNEAGGPNYPQEKVVQFCLRNYPPHLRASTRALDLGCGSGVNTVFLCEEGFRVTAVDISTVGVENTRRRLEERGLTAGLRVEGIDALSFAPASFDLVICCGVLDSAGPSAARRGVENVSRVLTPGGRGFFLFASERDFRVRGENPSELYGYSRREVETLFAHGFSKAWLDNYITTYQGGTIEQNDWLVTVER